jgi:putative DNA primase/helicase
MKQHAQRYIEKGWAVVRLAPREKRATESWRDKVYTVDDFGPDDNIAVKCGEPSDWLVDVDCDCPEAIIAARMLLPNTGLTHGRPGAPDSHYWFRCEGIKSETFKGPSGMIIEIRSTGGYTMLPPSVHPSGALLAFGTEGPLLDLTPEDLRAAVVAVPLAVEMGRAWPAPGVRHDAVGHFAGFLLQHGVDGFLVPKIIEAAATIAQDGDIRDRVKFAQNTVTKVRNGEDVTGGPKLAAIVGDDVVGRMRRVLKAHDEIVLDPKDPMPSARLFVQREHTVGGVLALRHQSEVFFRYDGIYRDWPEADVKAALYRFLEPAKRPTDKALLPFQPNRSKVENVLDALRGITNLPAHHSAPCWIEGDEPCDPMALLPCRNGLLHLPTRTLLPLTPRFFAVNGLAFEYDEHAPSPTEWLAFLDSIWPNDDASIDTLQEIIGYLLTVDTSFQKLFLIVGPKRSGKGTIARVLRDLIGEGNVCNPTLASFGRDFGKQVLVGKSLAVISDARLSGKTDAASVAEALLSISGEDSQTIARKFMHDWNGQLRVRFLILTNELPRIADMSGALASRYIILTMSQSFFGKEDRTLYSRLRHEIPGILRWALDGRDRLYQRGYFVQPDSAADMAQQLDDLGSPIKEFLRDCCEVLAGTRIKKQELFAAWRTWCAMNNQLNVGTAINFGKDLRAALPHIEGKQLRDETGAQAYFYIGLRLAADLPWEAAAPMF